jgi:hypothetical protein
LSKTQVRTVVNFIRGGTLREQYFQSKVKEAFGIEKELVKDVKHRWNMLEPVVKYKVQIIDTCNGFKESEMANGLDFEAIENLLNGVVPVKLAVEALSRQDATLVIADKTIEFLYDKLQQQNNGISTSLLENLKVRISERMNENVKNLLRCLKNPNTSLTASDLRFAKDLMVRLFHVETVGEQEEVVFMEEHISTLEDELNELLRNVYKEPEVDNDFKSLKSEFTAFARTGVRSANLKKLYDALLTIKPTSTDVERVFSITNWYCSKIRSRLSDKSLSALVF